MTGTSLHRLKPVPPESNMTSIYTKLTPTKRNIFGYSRLWLAPDHILLSSSPPNSPKITDDSPSPTFNRS